jgi:hypothetical protein
MRKTMLALLSTMAATLVFGTPPPKYLDIDSNFQQLQRLPALGIQQGADMRLILRLKSAGAWQDVTGYTAAWRGMSSITSTQYLEAASVYTSNSVHQIAMDLDSEQTGTSVTNWTYSIIVYSGTNTYPLGTGTLNIAESSYIGSQAVLIDGTNTWATKAYVDAAMQAIQLSNGDITSVAVSGGLLTGGGTNGAVTVTLSTNAVRAATAAAYEAAGAVSAHNTNAAAHAGLFDAAGSAAAVSNALAAGAAAGLTAVQVEADPTVAGAVSAHNTNASAHAALFAAARTNATSINGVAVATVTAGAALGATASQPGHTQAISTVTGLQAALDGKSPTNHNHTGVYAPIAEPVATNHIADPTEAHLQSAVDAVRVVTNIAASTAAGTQTVAFAWGESKRVRILATNSAVVVKLDWPAIANTNRTRFLRAEIWNPNLRSLTYADSGNWASNTSWVTTAPPNGKYRAWSVCNDGDEYEIIPIGGTNATERGGP